MDQKWPYDKSLLEALLDVIEAQRCVKSIAEVIGSQNQDALQAPCSVIRS